MSNIGIITNSYVLFNNVVFAGKVQSAILTYGKDVIDVSVYGSLGRIKALGLEDHKLDLVLMVDMAASGAGSTFNTVLDAIVGGVPVQVNYRMDSGSPSTTNQEFQCEYVVPSMPIGAKFGDYATLTISLQSSGQMTIKTTP